MATNADFDALIVRINTATNTLETDVATITAGADNVQESVAAAQLAEANAEAAAVDAAGQVTLAQDQVALAAAQANEAAQSVVEAQALVTELEGAVVIQEAPEDGQQYARQDGEWTVVTSGGGEGTVTSVNSIAPDEEGNVTLSASDVGAKPSSYVPTWGEVTGKPTTFAPIVGTAANQAMPGNTVIPTNTNQLTNGAGFVTAATAPVRSVAGKTGVVTLAGEDITSGVVAPERLGTGTPTADLVLKGDGTWGSAPAGNMPLSEGSVKMYGNTVTSWPFASIFQGVKLDQVSNTAGTVVGAQWFSTNSTLNNMPGGFYAFDSNDFSTGSLSGKGGFILVVNGELGSVGNFQTRAVAWVDMAFTAGAIGEFYIWKNDGTWVRVNGTA
jgi:hypothetical protein